MKKTNKDHVILRGETYNEIVRRLDALERRYPAVGRQFIDYQANVTNETSTAWPAFSVVSLDSPQPATGFFFNESKGIVGDITPAAHVYDPDGRYGITQQGALPSNGTFFDSVPVVVAGYTTVRMKAGGDPSHKFVKPSDESGKMETTTDVTPFRLVGIDTAADYAKILIQGGGGGEGTTMVIARVLADNNEINATISARIKATICGDIQTVGQDIQVENLRSGNYTTPDDNGAYSHNYPAEGEAVAILKRGMNIIAVKSRADFSLGTGWTWLQAGGVFVDI